LTTSILSSVAKYKKEDDAIVLDDDVYYCLLVESLDSGDTRTLSEATEEEGAKDDEIQPEDDTVTYWHVIISTYCMLYFVYAYLSRLAHYANPESTHIHAVCMNNQNKSLRQHTTDTPQVSTRSGRRPARNKNSDLFFY